MKKILVVDDDEGIRDFLKISLEQRGGYEVVVAEDGFQALKLYLLYLESNFDFDVIITAIQISEMDGLKLIKLIKTINKTQRFIAISDCPTEKASIKRFLGQQNIRLLKKPKKPFSASSSTELLLVVSRVLASREK